MRGTTRLLLAFVGSVAAAVVLGLLIQHALPDRPSVPGSGRAEAVQLSDANLVDHFARMGLQLRLDRVEFRKSYLAVDLKHGGEAGAANVFEDVLTMNRFAFERTDNVERLLIRVVEGSRGSERLLLALEASRGAWNEKLSGANMSGEQAWHAMMDAFDVTVTPEWENRFSR